MYDDFQIISANLKYLREKSGYTQEQLAEITGLYGHTKPPAG